MKMKLSFKAACVLSGALFLAIGFFLMAKGLNLVILSTYFSRFGIPACILPFLARLTGGPQNGALFLLVVSLALGLLKGRFVIIRSVKKTVQQLIQLPQPLPITKIFTLKYLLLVSSMMLLGILLRFLPEDLHGALDVAIGSALIQGGVTYLRCALTTKTFTCQ